MNPSPRNARRVLVLGGPTASGKTAVALALSSHIRCQIIGADARQIYRGIDIGTAKPSPAELSMVKHHCIDKRDPKETYTAADYSTDARAAIASVPINSLPILVGGSGLYIAAALDGLSVGGIATDEQTRERVQREFDERGRESMYAELESIDPRSAKLYEDRNPRRIQRAIEFYRMTGRPFSETFDTPRDAANVEAMYIGITQDRAVLHARIDARCEHMFASGLVDETRRLLDEGVDRGAQSLRTVGYYEAISVIDGIRTEKEALDDLQKSTRRYAKRQGTWFRKDKRYEWINGDVDTMVRRALAMLNAKGWLSDFVDLQPIKSGKNV
ncbi:MAG: tRNA (adenosine(37)-N6)-dimethylallyltransferase MiaA [Candidatus Kapabacteria bacterium]|nr:tRNA (adenosine(37)-N6)-dimethylallyltransferase MiaA [Candidatus Kapabacteria bacterium]